MTDSLSETPIPLVDQIKDMQLRMPDDLPPMAISSPEVTLETSLYDKVNPNPIHGRGVGADGYLSSTETVTNDKSEEYLAAAGSQDARSDGELDDIPCSTELIAEFSEQMSRFMVSLALTNAALHLGHGQDIEAEDCALESLELAKKLNNEAASAQSIYWLGRVEYYRGNYIKAHRHFLDARPCIGEDPEGQDVTLFLSLFQRGITGDDRQRMIRSHYARLWPVPKSSVFGTPHARLSDEMSTTESRPVESPRPAQRTKRKQTSLDSPFVFTEYPKGLAERYRPTQVIPEQSFEWIMPKSVWKTVQENWRNKSVTMSFLALEREELRRRAKEKEVV